MACNQCSPQRARCLPRPQGAIIERQRIQPELEKVFAREPWGKEVLPLVGPLALRSLQEIKGGKRPVAMSAPSGTAETADILMTPAWHACAHNGASSPRSQAPPRLRKPWRTLSSALEVTRIARRRQVMASKEFGISSKVID